MSLNRLFIYLNLSTFFICGFISTMEIFVSWQNSLLLLLLFFQKRKLTINNKIHLQYGQQGLNPSPRRKILIFLGPIHTYPDIFENVDFFLRLSLPSGSTAFRIIFENGPRSRGVLSKNAGLSCWFGRTKTEISITMMSYIIQPMTCRTCGRSLFSYRLSGYQVKIICVRD